MTLQQISSIYREIETDLDFILLHFEQPVIFPRNVMATELLDGKKYQHFKIVYSREEALAHFQRCNFVDCRINAFPSLKQGILWKPELLFIDLDLIDFKSIKSLDLALSKTKKNIKEKLNGGIPTIMKSGNGYHIIQPIYCPIELEHIREFQKYKDVLPLLSQRFLRFAKDFLSNSKADRANYPSFNSCLLRIPSSINSKCLIDNRDKRFSGNFRVKVVQSWNSVRVPISREFIEDFRTYLEQKVTDQEQEEVNNNTHQHQKYSNISIECIEKLLKIPIADFRKNSVSLILAPYLINIKKLSYQESFDILIEWLHNCDSIRKLDFNPKYLIKTALNTANQKRIPPMKFETLKTKNLELYHIMKKV